MKRYTRNELASIVWDSFGKKRPGCDILWVTENLTRINNLRYEWDLEVLKSRGN